MFTGMCEATADVRASKRGVLRVRRPPAFRDIKPGASISVSGVCLTVTKLIKEEMCFDVSPETMNVTTLGALQKGDFVNLERALPMQGRLDGHLVQGHVEGMGRVIGQRTADSGQRTADRGLRTSDSGQRGAAELEIELPSALAKFVIVKGSITVDGVSLTVAAKKGNRIRMALIPETLVRTTLGNLKNGNRVNIETDMIGKYVAAFVKQS